MDTYIDNIYYTDPNNTNYYYTIEQAPQNNNSAYTTYSHSIKNLKIPLSNYATNTHLYLTENTKNYSNPNTAKLYDTTNLNAYNNPQYIDTSHNYKKYQTITLGPYQNQQRTIKITPNVNNIINKVATLTTFNYKITSNNAQQKKYPKTNTINNANQAQRINTVIQKPVKLVYQNLNIGNLSADKIRVSTKRPIQHGNGNNIQIMQKVHSSLNNLNINSPKNIKIKGEIIEPAKVVRLTNNIKKEKKNNISPLLITIPNSNSNRVYNNLRYSNYIQTEKIPITDTYNFKLINNVNANTHKNKNPMTQSVHIQNKKPKINNEQNYIIKYENLNSPKNIQNTSSIKYEIKSNPTIKINGNISNNIPTIMEFIIPENETEVKVPLKTEVGLPPQSSSSFFSLNGELISNSKSEKYFRQTNSAPVKSYGYYQNQGHRNYMEDEGKVIENFNGDPNKILFCLFDGHGGGQVSKFLQQNFGNYMKKILNSENYTIAFTNLFKIIDEDIKKLNCPSVGSTATIVYIEKKDNKRILYCANIGDSRCVLVNKNKVIRLTYDHRVADPNERNRILSNGGIIVNGRVYGILMLSRSFGDFLTKDFGVIITPHVVKYELSDDDLYCVIASDGVWDVIKDNDCAILPKMGFETGELSKRIIVESLKRKSKDNLSCFVIKLN